MASEQDLIQQLAQLSQQQKAIGQQLNQSNQNMRSLLQRVWNMQERERKSIATELHDGVGQLLTALVNQLELLVEQDGNEFNQNVLQLARQSLQDVRLISRLMHPQILDDLGLKAALNWLVRQMNASNSLCVSLDYAEDFLPSPELNIIFFRVCQESLSNIVKHAEASHVDIALRNAGNQWYLSVTDNGKGFSITKEKAHGFGLSSMEDRITSFGGKLTIESQPGEGCSITVLIDKSAVALETI